MKNKLVNYIIAIALCLITALGVAQLEETPNDPAKFPSTRIELNPPTVASGLPGFTMEDNHKASIEQGKDSTKKGFTSNEGFYLFEGLFDKSPLK